MIKMKRKIVQSLVLTVGMITITVIYILVHHPFAAAAYYAGGAVLLAEYPALEGIKPVISSQTEDYSERYQRPSKKLPLPNPYTYQSYSQSKTQNQFKHPEDVIYAYFGVLKEASNMIGYSGGCGTIGNASLPYPYAYQMFTPEAREEMTPEQFEESFQGIGHITFLQLHPLPSLQNGAADELNYMIEIEVITGSKETEDETYNQELSYFAYYYGTVTVKNIDNNWNIQNIQYHSEEFLCAPYHSWFYDAESVVQIIYIGNLKLVDKITDTIYKDGMIYIYGYGDGKQYRFDFVRLTNGHDLLINENVKVDGKWQSMNLLTDDWASFKYF